MEYFETAAYAHERLMESIEESLQELSARVARRSEIEGKIHWGHVGDLRRLNDLLEEALGSFKDIN